MEREHLNPPGLFRHPAFTRVVSVEGPRKTIYFAGQTSTDEQNTVVGRGDYLAQYRQIMTNLTVALTAAGATWDDVVFKRQYTLDIERYRAAVSDPGNPRYWDPERPPPSTLLGVTSLANPDFLIEIEIVAVVEGDQA
ncbi:MAG: RidA family protein [Acidimicrobiales bacterium]|nr:RidA family protein [Acidimicrobiales bacterium]MBO0886339.1 RidA family protein [Acidimicrobiales bacterium]